MSVNQVTEKTTAQIGKW